MSVRFGSISLPGAGIDPATTAHRRQLGCPCVDNPENDLSDREKRLLTIVRLLEEEDLDALLRVAERMLPPTTVHRPPGTPGNEN
jgi:hypothetical protein